MRPRNWLMPISETIRSHLQSETIIPQLCFLISGLLVCAVPPFFMGLWPNLFLPFLYLWGLFYPERVQLLLVGAIGVLHDVYSGVPLGFHSFLYMILYLLALSQRSIIIGRPFVVIWVSFVFFILCISGIGILFARFFEEFPENSFDLQFHMVMTIGILPLLYHMFQPMFGKFRNL